MAAVFAAGTLAEFFFKFLSDFEWGEDLALVLAAAIHGALLLVLFEVASYVFTWAERKVSGRIQDRLGPTRVGGRFGWLQSLADGVKLIQKEDLVPAAADGMLFRVAPYVTCVAAFTAFMLIPFADGWVAVASDVGLFLIFGILSLEAVGIILAGYSSGSKWSLYGGMREAAQMVSYEIPLAICALVPIVAAGTLNLGEIGRMQSGGFWNWFLFHDPFTFLAFFVYFTVAIAGCKRAPFDLAEAESELVGGFHTEYSGFRWSFFFMAEYGSMFLASALACILFLGGWNTGIGIEALLEPVRRWAPDFLVDGFGLGNYLVNLVGMVVLIVKGSALVFFQIWLRWTLPRLRIDQVMMTCLKYLIPISCFLFLGAILWPLLLVSVFDVTHWAGPLGEKQYGVRSAECGVPRDTDAETRRHGDTGTSPEIAASPLPRVPASHSVLAEGGNR